MQKQQWSSGDQILTFTEDNQYDAEGEITVNVVSSVDGVVVGETTQTTNTINSGSWEINDNQLILSDSVTGEFPMIIITLNAETLELFLEVDNDILNLPDDPQFGEVTEQGTVTYTKVE